MKKYIVIILLSVSALISCQEKVEYVKADWVQLLTPTDGETMLISAEQDEILFVWAKREGATYRLSFDDSQSFDNPQSFDIGPEESFTITAGELHRTLLKIDPSFSGTKRFFWRVEQTLDGQTKTCWRYFNAVYAAGSFVDERDGITYNTITYDIDENTRYEIMSENLRATRYCDGAPLAKGYRTCNAKEWEDDGIFVASVGCYYAWSDAVRMNWDEAKYAYERGEQVQGICPAGWHLPGYEEFQNLVFFFGGSDNGGLSICTTSYWQKMTGITNSRRFNLLPSGFFFGTDDNEICSSVGTIAYLWSSTPVVGETIYAWGTWEENDKRGYAGAMCVWAETDGGVRHYYQACGENGESDKMFPVRCIKNYTKTEK